MPEDSLALLRQDIVMHSNSLTMIVQDQRRQNEVLQELLRERDVRKERDVRWNERFEDIARDVTEIKAIGKWILAGFGIIIITAIGNFIVSGGLNLASPQ